MSAISQLRLKVSVDGAETRRFALEAPVNYARLRQLIENLLHAQGFTILYTDDEGEQVTIASDADLREAMTLMEEMQQKALKLTVFTAVQAPVQKEVVKEPVLASPAAEEKAAPVEDNAEQDKAKFDEALAYIVNEFSNLDPLSIEDEILSLVVLFQQFSQRIDAGVQVHWDTLVSQFTANAPLISSLPCFHENHQKFLDALETITKFFVERVESGLLYPIPPHLAPLMFMKSEKVLKGFSQIQGSPLQLQVVLENLAAFVGKLEAVHAQPDEGQADEKVDSTVHTGVQCDNCKVVPIVGNRYKCTACHNFDLCESCESSDVHPADHELIKFKVAFVRGHRFGGPFGQCHGGRGRRWRNSRCPWNVSGREQFKREASPVPAAQPLKDGMGSEFLRDVNIEDKTRLGRGQMHVKTWSVRNDGKVDWDNTVKLVYASGNREILLDEQDQFDVPLLKSGETGDINVPFVVPEQAGSYKTVFRFVKNGEQFGHHLWVEFISE